MRNLAYLRDGKCLIRYFKDRGRCMNIWKQVFPLFDRPREIGFKTLGEGNELAKAQLKHEQDVK